MSKRTDFYEEVTNKIVELLQSHQDSWDKPWISLGMDGQPAHNAGSSHTYRGINQFLLGYTAFDKGYPKNGWLTFKQVKELGGSVLKGSKSSGVYFFKMLYSDANNKRISEKALEAMNEEQKKALKVIPMLKKHAVFNIFQTKDLPDEFYQYEENTVELTPFEKDDRAEALIEGTGAKIIIKQSNRAYYEMTSDTITLPLREQFKGKEAFYETSLHELGHWTGHPKRLKRSMSGSFKSKTYAKEELIAEMCSAYCCASLGFTKHISNNAAYLRSWLTALKEDTKFIFSVARQAQNASDFILNYE